METVTVKSRVYQIGGLYMFGAAGIYPLLGVKGDMFHFGHHPADEGSSYNCEEISLNLGTITDAPIELEDGDMCRFEYQNTHCMGFYSKANKSFVNFGETICFLREVIMIDPLVSK